MERIEVNPLDGQYGGEGDGGENTWMNRCFADLRYKQMPKFDCYSLSEFRWQIEYFLVLGWYGLC